MRQTSPSNTFSAYIVTSSTSASKRHVQCRAEYHPDDLRTAVELVAITGKSIKVFFDPKDDPTHQTENYPPEYYVSMQESTTEVIDLTGDSDDENVNE